MGKSEDHRENELALITPPWQWRADLRKFAQPLAKDVLNAQCRHPVCVGSVCNWGTLSFERHSYRFGRHLQQGHHVLGHLKALFRLPMLALEKLLHFHANPQQ